MNMVVHPDAVQMAHQYGCAAAKQKKFIEYKQAFWDKAWPPYAASGGRDQSSMGEDAILGWASGLGLDGKKLKADANSTECKERVEADEAELQKFHVNGTPGFFINGKHIAGGIPKEAFKQIIDEKLAIAEKSGVGGAEYYAREIFAKGEKKFRSKKDAKPKP
jgi:protein-disulfide isomerase